MCYPLHYRTPYIILICTRIPAHIDTCTVYILTGAPKKQRFVLAEMSAAHDLSPGELYERVSEQGEAVRALKAQNAQKVREEIRRMKGTKGSSFFQLDDCLGIG